MPDANGYLVPAEREILLRHYAPVLVLFPEDPARAPYPDDGDAIYTVRGGYHPRTAVFAAKRARVRYRWRVLLRDPLLFFNPRPLEEELERAREAVTAENLHDLIVQHRDDPRYAGLSEAQIRPALITRLVEQQLARRVRGLDLPAFRGHNLKHWRLYFEYLAEDEPEERRATIYGRLLQGLAPPGEEALSPLAHAAQTSTFGPYDISRGRVALQYWLHYYYDDWANRHEGDWESITILLDLEPWVIGAGRELDADELLQGCAGRDAGYSSHEDGYRRAWKDVQRTADGRPIVYVARGSQASYFGWRLEGYPTSARVTFVENFLAALGSLVQGKRIFGRRWDAEFGARFTARDPKNTDWTPADPDTEDRLSPQTQNPVEGKIPRQCRGVRRLPAFGPDAGLDDGTYHLEIDDLFWLELVQEFGVQWGENFFLPGTKGPSGLSKAERDKQRRMINSLARLEFEITEALARLVQHRAKDGSLADALHPLRPDVLKAANCFPNSIRRHVYQLWGTMLAAQSDAWPGGPDLWTRLQIGRRRDQGALLDRDDPAFHLKTLLAQVRRTRYEVQHEGSKWDNPFAWVGYVCRADTFYYGVTGSGANDALALDQIDCSDRPRSMV